MVVSEKRRKYLKEYYKANKEAAFERTKRWKQNNPERYKEIRKAAQRKYNLSPAYRYKTIKRNSKTKGREVLITKKTFINWFENIPKICVYCGVTERISKEKGFGILEIDRKNNNLGYSLDNIALACRLCNGIKGEYLTEKEAKFIGENVIKSKWEKFD